MLEKVLVTSPTVTLSILRRWLSAFTTWGDIMQGLESGALVDSCNTGNVVTGPPDDVPIAVFPATPLGDSSGPVNDVLPVTPPVKPPAPPNNVLPPAPSVEPSATPDDVLPPDAPPATADAPPVLPAAPSVEAPAPPDDVLPITPTVKPPAPSDNVLPADPPDDVPSDATPVKPFVLPVEPSVAPNDVLPVCPPASPADAAPTVVSDEAPESVPICCGGVVFPEASTRVELKVESEQLIVNEDCRNSSSVVAAANSWTWYEYTSFK